MRLLRFAHVRVPSSCVLIRLCTVLQQCIKIYKVPLSAFDTDEEDEEDGDDGAAGAANPSL
jgi:hypothetical protein